MTKLMKVSPDNFNDNVFKLIGTDWMLIAAGTTASCNTMTASWGAMGVLWNKNVCFCFIRPQRYTREFVEKNEIFTLSFFEEKHRNSLNICGAVSGRDSDKIKQSGLTVMQSPSGSVTFREARLVVECKKIYFQDLDPKNFLDASIAGNYPKKDYHRMYIGEVLGCYLNK